MRAARSCECHELSRTVLLRPALEDDLEEMTQVLKTAANAQRRPSLRSHPTPHDVAFFSFVFPSPVSALLFLLPHLSFHLFPSLSVLSSLLSPFASFSPFIPLPLFVTSGSSLPGDLQWRKEASPFPLLLNTCSCYNVWKKEKHDGYVSIKSHFNLTVLYRAICAIHSRKCVENWTAVSPL